MPNESSFLNQTRLDRSRLSDKSAINNLEEEVFGGNACKVKKVRSEDVVTAENERKVGVES